MTAELQASYALCRQVARRAAKNFYYTFLLLPRDKRRAMCALYAFLRRTDDLGDNPQPAETRREALSRWRESLDRAMHGTYDHPLLPALADTLARYAIPPQYLFDTIDGVEMDIDGRQYETFEELEQYCYRVASVVGLACIHVWGFRGEEAFEPARKCGLAFQLTNILRDLKEDAEQGRVYLPREDLDRFGYSADGLRRGVRNARFRALMRFEIARTEALYREGRELQRWLDPDGLPVFGAMVSTYQALLEEIKRRDGDVFTARVRLSPWRKLSIAARWLRVHPAAARWSWGALRQ